MNTDIRAKKKLISYLLKKDPSLTDKEIGLLLNNIRRFVTVVQKIYTEPQATIKYKDLKVDGKKIKTRIIETDIEELSKVNGKTGKPITIETIREFNEKITGIKPIKHGR